MDLPLGEKVFVHRKWILSVSFGPTLTFGANISPFPPVIVRVGLRIGFCRHRKSKIEIEKLVIGQQAKYSRHIFDFRPNLQEGPS